MQQGGAVALRRRWRRLQGRRYRHVLIGACAAAVLAAVSLAADPRARITVLSMFTAYIGLILLTASLTIGPANVLLKRANPVSNDTRRTVGIWAAAFALLHTVLGLQVHMGGRVRSYFMAPDQSWFPLRIDLFGWSNHAGLSAAVMLAGLLILSNDAALRRLGVRRWKRWQRSSYGASLLVILHGAAYQFMEKRTAILVLLFVVLTVVLASTQIAAYRRVRQRNRLE